jgi:hypothetical protein
MYGRYSALATAAAEHGDVEGAVKLVKQAHGYVPDGRQLTLEPSNKGEGLYDYQLTDIASGRVIEKKTAGVEDVMAAASKANQTGFDQMIVQAAGQRAGKQQPTADGGSDVPKLTDRVKASDAVAAYVDALPDAEKSTVTPENTSAAKNIASQMLLGNDITPADAYAATTALMDPYGPKWASVKTLPGPDGGIRVRLGDKREVTLSKNAAAQLAAIQGRALKLRGRRSSEDRAGNRRRRPAHLAPANGPRC